MRPLILVLIVAGSITTLRAEEPADLAARCEAIAWDGKIGSRPPPELMAIARELQAAGPKALERIGLALDDSVNLQRIAPKIVSAWPSDQTRSILRRVLGGRDFRAARSAAHHLGNVGGAEVVDALLAATKHADGNVRHNALNALGRMGAHRHGLDAGLLAVQDKPFWIRHSAYQFLEGVKWKQGIERARPVLEAMRAKETDKGAKGALERTLRVMRARLGP